MGYQIDNMEGLAVHRTDAGDIVLTLVSDDNFSPLQRTMLLQFTLVAEACHAASGVVAVVIRMPRAMNELRPPRRASCDLALEFERAARQFVVLRLDQEGVEAAAMVDGLERVGGNAQPHRTVERCPTSA